MSDADHTRAMIVRTPGGPEVLEPADVPLRAPGPGEVRVAVRSIAVNFRDVHQRRGSTPGATLPLVPGSDFAGDVVSVGDGVDATRVGARVFGAVADGAYAADVVLPAAMALPLPDDVDYDTGAIVPVAGLSASFLVTGAGADLDEGGESATAVTYAAAGGLGCLLGGLLAARGVRSIGLTSTQAKAEVARRAGHAEVILYPDVDPVQAVMDLTGGRGADVVFDSVGGPAFARSFRMLRNEGTVVLCGRAAGDPDLGAAYVDFVEARRNLGMREFFLMTSIADHFAEVPVRAAELVAALRSGAVRVPITAFPLGEVARAHQLVESGATVGKVVLRP
jgi:NADPH2:quinone reductase